LNSHSDNIPNFIEARNPKELRALMFKKNAETGSLNKYFDISSYVNKSGKIRWIAWFYQRVEDAAAEL
jgi:hypothetical protein